jgi:hypothetical protein
VKRFFDSFADFPRNKRGEITQQRVTDILTHPIYTGHICSKNYGISWLKGQHAPRITLEAFDKVQERRGGVAKAPKRANICVDFVMRGMVNCSCCTVSMRSSFARGRLGGRFPYYLCQTKGCDAYGKSIRREPLEDDVGEIIETLQPTRDVIAMAKAMFLHAWEQRRAQAKDILRSGKRQIDALDKEIDTVLQRIMTASNETDIRSY